ncbi:hypothetical protein RPE78_08225 [Thioclava litoralis]|uniref:Lipoprotein n=1 Tax=Thioclava litoralis TaxID=3076557 RepID=A0ABZ1DVC7_9RHOB|nr:hypothetical protein RPE78_08225 [Thioclava sp. FTW29]
MASLFCPSEVAFENVSPIKGRVEDGMMKRRIADLLKNTRTAPGQGGLSALGHAIIPHASVSGSFSLNSMQFSARGATALDNVETFSPTYSANGVRMARANMPRRRAFNMNTTKTTSFFRLGKAALLGACAVGLTACGPGNYWGSGKIHEQADTAGSEIQDQMVKAAPGPITTGPIVGRSKVPAGTTPTGDTGYAVANSARTNGTIVNGQAARCTSANDWSKYSDGCAHAAGLSAASQPYISPYSK